MSISHRDSASYCPNRQWGIARSHPFQPLLLWHQEIENNEVCWRRAIALASLVPVAGFLHNIAVLLQRRAEHAAKVIVIVDEEDADHRDAYASVIAPAPDG